MKKFFILSLLLAAFAVQLANAQEVIVGWTFEDENDTEFQPNMGLSANSSYKLYAETLSLGWQQGQREIVIAEGYEDFAAQASNWEDGADDKVWSIRFDAPSFTNMSFTSRQYSSPEGPKNWKIQMRVSGGSWEDLPDSEYNVSDDWETGYIEEFEIPAEYNNQQASLFIRWIMTDNEAVNGDDVTEIGFSRIDDIIVTGYDASGDKVQLLNSAVNIYPNPATEYIIVDTEMNINNFNIYNANGSLVKTISNKISDNQHINISGLSSGNYLLQISFENKNENLIKRFTVN